jgi:hypothetical protein
MSSPCPYNCLPKYSFERKDAGTASLHLVLTSATTISKTDATMPESKGIGNMRKQGSGGNSYYGYLRRKIGGCQCSQ